MSSDDKKPQARFARKSKGAAGQDAPPPPPPVDKTASKSTQHPSAVAPAPTAQQQHSQPQQVVFVPSAVPVQAPKFVAMAKVKAPRGAKGGKAEKVEKQAKQTKQAKQQPQEQAAPVGGKLPKPLKGKKGAKGAVQQPDPTPIANLAPPTGGRKPKKEPQNIPQVQPVSFSFIPNQSQQDLDPDLPNRLSTAITTTLETDPDKIKAWLKPLAYFYMTNSIQFLQFIGLDAAQRATIHSASDLLDLSSKSTGAKSNRILLVSRIGKPLTPRTTSVIVDALRNEYSHAKAILDGTYNPSATSYKQHSYQSTSDANDTMSSTEASLGGVIDETMSRPSLQVLSKLLLQYNDHLNYPLYSTQTVTSEFDASNVDDRYRVVGMKDVISSDLTDYTQFTRDLGELHQDQLDSITKIRKTTQMTQQKLTKTLTHQFKGDTFKIAQDPKMLQVTQELEQLNKLALNHEQQVLSPDDISILSSDLFINPHVCSSNCPVDQEHYNQVMCGTGEEAGIIGGNIGTQHPNLVKKCCYRKFADPITREWSPTDADLAQDTALVYHSKAELAKQIKLARERMTSESGQGKRNMTKASAKTADAVHAAPVDPVVLALPVRTHATRVLHALHHNNVVVVVGQTGSGKSTQIPQLIFEHFHQCTLCQSSHGRNKEHQHSHHHKNDRFSEAKILCTQPRRLAAISLAQRVADERGELNHTKNEKQLAQKKLKEQLRMISSGAAGGDLIGGNDGGSAELVGVDYDQDLEIYQADGDVDLVDADDIDHDQDLYLDPQNRQQNGDEFEVASDVEVEDDGEDSKNQFRDKKDNKQSNKDAHDESEPRVEIAENSVVGYAVKNQSKNPHANIVYCTSGLFLRRITMGAGGTDARSSSSRHFNSQNFGSLAHFNPLFSQWMQCHDAAVLAHNNIALKQAQMEDITPIDSPTSLATTTTTSTTSVTSPPTKNQLKTLSNKAMALFTSIYSPFVHRLLFALRKYTHIIIDEAHERDKLIDFTLILLKVALLVRKDLKVIIMSATINSSLFSDYFNAPIINIEGRTFPVDIFYLHHSILLSEVALAQKGNYSSLYKLNATGSAIGSEAQPYKAFTQLQHDAELYINAVLKRADNDARIAQGLPPIGPTKRGPNDIPEFTVEDFPSDFTRFFECGNSRQYESSMLLHSLTNVNLETVANEFAAMNPPPKPNCGPLCPCYLTAFPLSTCCNVVVTSYNLQPPKVGRSGALGGGKQNKALSALNNVAIPAAQQLPMKQAAGRVADTVRVLEGLLSYITDRQIDSNVLDKCLRGIVLGSQAADEEEIRQKAFVAEQGTTTAVITKQQEAQNQAKQQQVQHDLDNYHSQGGLDELEALLGDMDLNDTPVAPAPVKEQPTQQSQFVLKDLSAARAAQKKAAQVVESLPPATWSSTPATNSISSNAGKNPKSSTSVVNVTANPSAKQYPARNTTNDLFCMPREKLPFGAILIFVAGWGDITTISEFLLKHPVFGSDRYNVIPLHSTVPLDQQQLAFELPSVQFSDGQLYDSDDIRAHYTSEAAKASTTTTPGNKKAPRPVDPRWKIIVSTNIAETSLTIADCLYVFDFGCHKEKIYNAAADFSSFSSTFISQSNCAQRSGRAGRVRHGYCFRFYDLPIFTSFPQFPKPEVLTTSIEDLVLSTSLLTLTKNSDDQNHDGQKTLLSSTILKKHENYLKQLSFYQQHQLDLFGNTSVESPLRIKHKSGTPKHKENKHYEFQRYNCAQFLSLMPQPPPITNIIKAIHSLQLVNALDSFEHPTSLSSIFISLPLPPRLTKMLILSLLFGCFDHGLTAVSVLTSPPVFVGKQPPGVKKITIHKPEEKAQFFALEPVEYSPEGMMINPFVRSANAADSILGKIKNGEEEQVDIVEADQAKLNCFASPSSLRQLLTNSTGSDVIASIHGFYAWLNAGVAYQDRRIFARNIGIAHSACNTIAQTRKQLFDLLNSHPTLQHYIQTPMLGAERYQAMTIGGPSYVAALPSESNNSTPQRVVTMDWISKLVIYTPAPKGYVKPPKTYSRFYNPLNSPPSGYMAWNPPYYQECTDLINHLPHHILFATQQHSLALAVSKFNPTHYRLPSYVESDLGLNNGGDNTSGAGSYSAAATSLLPPRESDAHQPPRSNKGKPLSLINSHNLTLLAGIISTGQSFSLRNIYNLGLEGTRNPYSLQQVNFPPIPSIIAPEDDTDPFATTAPHYTSDILNYSTSLSPLSDVIRLNPEEHSTDILDYPLLKSGSKHLLKQFSEVSTMNGVHVPVKTITQQPDLDLFFRDSPGSLHQFNIDYFNLDNLNKPPMLPSAPIPQSQSPHMFRTSFLPLVSYNECIVTAGNQPRLADCTPTHPAFLMFTNPNLSQIKHNYNVFHVNPYLGYLSFANYFYQQKLSGLYNQHLEMKYPYVRQRLTEHVEPNFFDKRDKELSDFKPKTDSFQERLNHFYTQTARIKDFLTSQVITTAPTFNGVVNSTSTNSQPIHTVATPTPNTLLCDYIRRVLAPVSNTPVNTAPQQQLQQQQQQQPSMLMKPNIDASTTMSAYMTKSKYLQPMSPNQLPAINKAVQDSILWLMISMLYRIHIYTSKFPQSLSSVNLNNPGGEEIELSRQRVTAPSICQVFVPGLTLQCESFDPQTAEPKQQTEIGFGAGKQMTVYLELAFNFQRRPLDEMFHSKSAAFRPTPNSRRTQTHFDKVSNCFVKRATITLDAAGHIDHYKKTFKLPFQSIITLMQQLLVDTIYNPQFNISFLSPRLIAPALIGMTPIEQLYTTEFIQTNITRLVQVALSPEATSAQFAQQGLSTQASTSNPPQSFGKNSRFNKSSLNPNSANTALPTHNLTGTLNLTQHHWNHYLLTQLAAGVSTAVSTDLMHNSYHYYLQYLASNPKFPSELMSSNPFQNPQMLEKYTGQLHQFDVSVNKSVSQLYPMIDPHDAIRGKGSYSNGQNWCEYLEQTCGYSPYYNITTHLSQNPHTIKIKQELPLYTLGYIFHYFSESLPEKLQNLQRTSVARDDHARSIALGRR